MDHGSNTQEDRARILRACAILEGFEPPTVLHDTQLLLSLDEVKMLYVDHVCHWTKSDKQASEVLGIHYETLRRLRRRNGKE
jgi:DNA-binding protein Fis